MYDIEKGYGNDTYGSSDLDQNKTKVHCSVVHGECHIMERHKEGQRGSQEIAVPRIRTVDERQVLS
jgi:ribonuclease PH